jgi:hypothetical protein
MASKKLSSDTSLANSYKLSRGVASVARPSAPTIGTATNTSFGLMSVTFTPSTLGPTASSYTLTSSSGRSASGASSPITLQETTEGTYTYTVYGTNGNGNGPLSSSSSSVVVDSVDPGAYFPIATTTLASSAASVTFGSIPSTYTHLQVRAIARSTTSGTAQDEIQLTMNGDTGSNYAYHFVYGNGSNAVAANGVSQTYIRSAFAPRASATTSSFGGLVLDVLDYKNTSKNTTIRSLSGGDLNNTEGLIALCSGLWINTSAVTSLTFKPESGNNFPQYTSFTLYGIKG